MALPTIARTWNFSPNNRIAYVSLVQTMREFLFGLKTRLVAAGYVVLGSSNGATATPAGLITVGNDSVDRWISATNAGTRATVAAAAQSWIVLRDGNGVDILLTFQGASDDICRISFSPGQLFTAAATSTHQPTATDERVMTSATTVIGSTASADRVWHTLISSDAKAFRVILARQNLVLGAWGVETLTSALVSPAVGVPLALPTWGFAYNRAGLAAGAVDSSYTASTRGGVARVVVASVGIDITVGGGTEGALGSGAVATQFGTFKPELQGTMGYPLTPLTIWSLTTGARGKLGTRIDWWLGRTGQPDGDTYGAKTFINLADSVWPWDGVTTPVMI